MRTHLGEVNLRPGICFWMRPGGLYIADQDPRNRLGATFIHFALEDRPRRRRNPDAPLPPLTHDLVDVHYADAITRRIIELSREDDPGSLAALDALLTGFLMDLDAQAERPQAWAAGGTARRHRELVLRLAARIGESSNERTSVKELARASGYSRDHFARVFKQVVGQGPHPFMLRARIDRARQLLLESGLSVGKIAEALGYQDVYFFSKQFKQKTGMAPSKYRSGGLLSTRQSG